MSALLIFGMFVVGIYAADLLAAIARSNVDMIAVFFYGAGFACIGAWVAFK